MTAPDLLAALEAAEKALGPWADIAANVPKSYDDAYVIRVSILDDGFMMSANDRFTLGDLRLAREAHSKVIASARAGSQQHAPTIAQLQTDFLRAQNALASRLLGDPTVGVSNAALAASVPEGEK